MNINIALCDDEESQLDYLESIIEKLKKQYEDKINLSVSRFFSAEEFLFKYEDKSDFHIIFLDVEMKEINGVELAQRIRKVDQCVQIIFITGYSEFMAEGYEVDALNYLLKPVNEQKLCQVFKRAMDKLKLHEGQGEDYVIFNDDESAKRFKLNSIMYLEAVGHQCKVFCTEYTCFIKESLGEVKDKLSMKPLQFILCHRSYLVNMQYVHTITKTHVILDNEDKLPISRRKYKEVNERFISYYTDDAK